MLTGKKIKKQALMWVKEGQAPLWGGGFVEGATWANEQNAAEIAALRAENTRISDALQSIINVHNSESASLGEMWYSETICDAIENVIAELAKTEKTI